MSARRKRAGAAATAELPLAVTAPAKPVAPAPAPVAVVHHGDCRTVLAGMPENSVHAVVTDPPYHLTTGKKGGSGPASLSLKTPYGRSRITTGFMGKHWDGGDVAFQVETWAEVFRVLKPGGHLLAFGAPRTYHRMACAIEDAGFDIRDSIRHEQSRQDVSVGYLFGTGFPKSSDVGKAIDKRDGNADQTTAIGAAIKAARQSRGLSVVQCDRMFCSGTSNWSWFEGRPVGQHAPMPEAFAAIAAAWPELAPFAGLIAEAARETLGQIKRTNVAVAPGQGVARGATTLDVTAPGTAAARQWQGFGSALKPAHEPIVCARKPLEGTLAENVLRHGCGALNIDACRIPYEDTPDPATNPLYRVQNGYKIAVGSDANGASFSLKPEGGEVTANALGRWPANVIHDGSEDVEAAFARFGANKGGAAPASGPTLRNGNTSVARGKFAGLPAGRDPAFHADTGTASRFFYGAKAGKRDRVIHCRDCQQSFWATERAEHQHGHVDAEGEPTWDHVGSHCTVKSQALMQYLVRLVCPPGGTVLDPFAGSGSTGQAALAEGFSPILIEMEPDYVQDCRFRLGLS